MRRPFLEIDCLSININSLEEDSVKKFLDYLHHKENISDTKVIEANKNLLTSLIQQKYISRSSIIWNRNDISKIYGISLDDKQYIQFHNRKDYTEKPIRNFDKVNSIDENEIDSIKKAFIRAKQTKLWSLREPIPP